MAKGMAAVGKASTLWRAILALLVFMGTLSLMGPATAETRPDDMWVTDGTVYDFAFADGKVFIAGDFSLVGPNTGGGTLVDTAAGDRDLAFDRIDGSVFDAVPDGAGGWYIAGDFIFVQGLWRPRVAHLGADGRVTGWRPAVDGLSVDALALIGTTLYMGGDFTAVDNTARSNLAALDVSSESVNLLSWSPSVNGAVRGIEASVDETALYFVGEFTDVNAIWRRRTAAVDTSGVVLAWDPKANDWVLDLEIDSAGTTVYLAGRFTDLDGTTRNRLAAVDATTGLFNSWDPSANSEVTSIELTADDSTLFAGGSFGTIGVTARSNAVAIDTTTGVPNGWNPSPDARVYDVSLSPDETVAYLAGNFLNVGGTTRYRLAGTDSTTGALNAWAPGANNGARLVAPHGSDVYVGGVFGSINVVEQANLAALDEVTGELVPGWDPLVNDIVRAVDVSPSGQVLYVGGHFDEVDTVLHRHVVGLDVTTGEVELTWDVRAGSIVRDISVGNGRVYLGGDFTVFNGETRTRLAAVDAVTGLNDATWVPTADDMVRAVAVSADGTKVYLGGEFDLLSGLSRREIGAVDAITGAVDLVWNPNSNRRVYMIDVTADGVYSAQGGAGGHMLAHHPDTGAELWHGIADGDVQAVTVSGNYVYVGGHFDFMDGVDRQRIVAMDALTGAVDLNWIPHTDSLLGVFGAAAHGGDIYIGGHFEKVSSLSANHVARLREIFSGSTDDYEGTVLTSAPAAYWRLGEASGTSVIDETAGGLDGTYLGTPTLGTTGLITDPSNTAVEFNGTDAAVHIPDATIINTGGPYEAKTIELWFDADDVTSRQVLYEQGGSARGLNIYLLNGSLYYSAWNINTDDITTPWGPEWVSTPVNVGETYHVVMVYEYPNRLEAYLDGVSVGAAAGPVGRLFSHSRDTGIGAMLDTARFHDLNSAGDGFYFDGVMDEVAVYNAALSNTEIAEHHFAGVTVGGESPPEVFTSAPTEGSLVSGSTLIEIVATDLQDADGTLTVETRIDGGAWELTTWNPLALVYEYDWDTTLVPDAFYTIEARATDSALNIVEDGIINVHVDNVNDAPAVSITWPPDGSSVGGVVTITADATDTEDLPGMLDVEVSTDGGTVWIPMIWDAGETQYEYDWDTTVIALGPYTIDVRATDSKFVTTNATGISVTVETLPYDERVEIDDPIAYWRLGEVSGPTAFDETLNIIHGTYLGTPTLASTGLITDPVDTAVTFNGTDSAVQNSGLAADQRGWPV